MPRKPKEKPKHEDLILDDDSFIPDDKEEAEFFNEITFLDDTPREWVRELKDEYGLSIRHHCLICFLAIKAGYFPDTRFPDTKDKCQQYYLVRNLHYISVNPNAFVKAYSKLVKGIKYEDNPTGIIQEEYISYALIEKVIPFIVKWYPYAFTYVKTLNSDPYRLYALHYYWILREILDAYPQSMEDFRKENCPHIKKHTFKSIHLRHYKDKIPIEMKNYLTPYIRLWYPDALG